MKGGRRGLAGLLVTGLVLGGAELLCRANPTPRMSDVPAAGESAETMMRGNPWLLWELVPGEHFERGGHVTINAAGFRDRPRGPRTRPRMVALGDSSVYGFGVDDEEVFTARLEATRNADFINAGVPGYSSFQSLNLTHGRVLDLDPDVLIVGNLWSDNNFDSFVDRELLAEYREWAGASVPRLRAALDDSALFRRLDWHLRLSGRQEAARKVGWQAGGNGPRSGNRRVSIRDYTENLASFCTLMHERGGGVLFLMLPNREDISQRAPSPAWDPYRTAMREVARGCGAPLVDGPASFQASGASADTLFIDQMHPTAAGHARLAEAVGAALAGAGWPEKPLTVGPRPSLLAVPPDPYEGQGGTAESADARPASLALTVRVPEGLLPATVAVHDADRSESPEPLGSAPLAAGQLTGGQGVLTVRLSRLPARVRVELEGKGRRVATGVVEGGAAEVDLR